MTEFEQDMLELYDLLPMRHFYPEKSGAYTKMYRMGMTERKIKRRLFQLTKHWPGGEDVQSATMIDRVWQIYTKPWGEQCKFYREPHRMHKKYAYESEAHDDWDYCAYKYYDRAKWNRRYKLEDLEPFRYDEPLTCVCCNRDTWGRHEGSLYYEVDRYYWSKWKRGWYEESYCGEAWEVEVVYFDKQENTPFYKIGQRLDWDKREELDVLYYKLNKG